MHVTLPAGTRPLLERSVRLAMSGGGITLSPWAWLEAGPIEAMDSHRPAGEKTDGRITIKAPAKRSLSAVEGGISALFWGQLDLTLSIEAPSVTMCPGAGRTWAITQNITLTHAGVHFSFSLSLFSLIPMQYYRHFLMEII